MKISTAPIRAPAQIKAIERISPERIKAMTMKAKKFVGSAKDVSGGFFCIEMAITRKNIQQVADAQGNFTFNIARQNRHLNELSCFVRSSSFHNKDDYAKIAFTSVKGTNIAELKKSCSKLYIPYKYDMYLP